MCIVISLRSLLKEKEGIKWNNKYLLNPTEYRKEEIKKQRTYERNGNK